MIRMEKATVQDAKCLAQLEALCFPEAQAASEAAIQRRLEVFGDHFLVLKKDGNIIGMINGCCSNRSAICDEMYANADLHDPSGCYQMIFGLDVHPQHRHQGYAQMLMEAMIQQTKAAQRKGLVLTCKKSLLSFYEQFGFCNRGISASIHGGVTWYDMLLYLE